MTVNEIKEKLVRKTVVFQTGGIRPTKELLESWIGCVCWKLPDEEMPVDKNDYPMWDGGGIPFDIEDEILRLEDEEDIEYFEDIAEENYGEHKIGGYPAFIQSGYEFEDYKFAFQISSDEKARFNFVDSGKIYFFYNEEENAWKVHYDFY